MGFIHVSHPVVVPLCITNKLKCNDDKSELLVLTARHCPSLLLTVLWLAMQKKIAQSKSARNIGITFDNTLTMQQYVAAICKSVFLHIRKIAQIRKCLSFESGQI